ncbi:MAG: helix-turn-helix transcriptional regulator [Aeromicrobium sp.]
MTAAGGDLSSNRSDAVIVGGYLAREVLTSLKTDARSAVGRGEQRTSAHRLEPELLTAAEAAAVLNIAPSTLRDWAAKGQGPRVYRLGPRQFRWDRHDLLAFMYSRRSDGAS